MLLFKNIIRNFSNLPGWRTNRKIIVIESDDWGSIRMPSRELYDQLLKEGIRVDNCPYSRYDSLASEEDLIRLFEVLSSVRDKYGNPAIITANTVVANPDFEKIRTSGFETYFYEPFTETLKRYPCHGNSFQLWQQGMRTGVFRPQFHGREHVNVKRWLIALQNDVGKNRLSFEYEMYDLSEDDKISENSFVDAFNFTAQDELEFQKQSIIEGLALFEQLFEFRSKTFIAPCYTWSRKLNKTLQDNGVDCFQGSWFQLEPIPGKQHRFKKIWHHTGQKNNLGQIYLVRNALFEPCNNPDFDFVSNCLSRIERAFKFNKPAIIGAHRLNFISFIDPENGNRNLLLLRKLLNNIVKHWPDVEFMSSDHLANLILLKLN